MSYKIGITGGIGAGKSLIAQIFQVLNIPVYNADQRAKSLMISDKQTREAIISLLGPKAYLPDGRLHSEYIASRVFPDPWLLNSLNAIIHPAIARDYHTWHVSQVDVPYTLKEAALLYDAGSYLTMDAIIVVAADEEVRIQRVMQRDRCSREDVQSRLNRQWSEDRRLQLADYVITNDGLQPLVPQVLRVHKEILH